MDKSAPDLARETPMPIDEQLRAGVEKSLMRRGPLHVEGRAGTNACVLLAVLADGRRAHEVFVFARGDGAADRCVDYLDGVVAEIFRTGGLLPLDWEGRPFEGGLVFVRSEIRDYEAEDAAAVLLGEAPPRRGLA